MIYVAPKFSTCKAVSFPNGSRSYSTIFDSLTTAADTDVCYTFLLNNTCIRVFTATCRHAEVFSENDYSEDDPGSNPHLRPSHLEIWSYGLLSICLVCSCAAFGFCFYPIMKKAIFQQILTGMIGLGVGCLSGIALFQLIPQSFGLSDESPEHLNAYLNKAAVMLAAIFLLMLFERILKITIQWRKEAGLNHNSITPKSQMTEDTDQSTTEQHCVQFPMKQCSDVPTEQQCLQCPMLQTMTSSCELLGNDADGSQNLTPPESDCFNKKFSVRRASESSVKSVVDNVHMHLHGCQASQSVQTVAWIILVGDGIVDGLSIGAAFSSSVLRGASISIAVLCEELPHELGDLAILLNSGLSLKRAILYNCASGLTCFLGFTVGVFLGELPEATGWIFAVAGGTFLYITFVNILPEMTAAVEETCRINIKTGIYTLMIQYFGLVSGLVLMYVLAKYSKDIRFE